MANHGHGDVEVGMDPRFSQKVYPRRDNIFLHKKSLNFDQVRSKIYVERERGSSVVILEWLAFAFIGVLTGLTASIMSNTEEMLTSFRRN